MKRDRKLDENSTVLRFSQLENLRVPCNFRCQGDMLKSDTYSVRWTTTRVPRAVVTARTGCPALAARKETLSDRFCRARRWRRAPNGRDYAQVSPIGRCPLS